MERREAIFLPLFFFLFFLLLLSPQRREREEKSFPFFLFLSFPFFPPSRVGKGRWREKKGGREDKAPSSPLPLLFFPPPSVPVFHLASKSGRRTGTERHGKERGSRHPPPFPLPLPFPFPLSPSSSMLHLYILLIRSVVCGEFSPSLFFPS